MERSMVIKVQYGDILRRFAVHIAENDQLEVDFNGLRGKIISLFNLPPESQFTLTYVDEDGDLVTLVDDEDLRDVVRQSLKFLRINVQLNNENGRTYASSSVNSTPLRSPRVQHPLQNLNSGVEEVLKSIPEPLREALSKLSSDIAAKATSSSPKIAEIVDHFLKMGQFCVNPTTPPQKSAQEGVRCPLDPSMTNDLNASKDGSAIGAVLKNGVGLDSKTRKEVDVGDRAGDQGLSSVSVPHSVDLKLDLPHGSDFVAAHVAQDALKSAVPHNKENKASDKHRKAESPGLAASSSYNPWNPAGVVNSVPPSASDTAGTSFTRFGVGPKQKFGFPTDSAANPVRPLFSARDWPTARSRSHGGVVFHRGVQCAGCGVQPITGPRYKSKVRENFDLCGICFSEMGNETDYIRLDRPASYSPSFWYLNQSIHPHNMPTAWDSEPAAANSFRDYGMKIRPKLDGRFVFDVNIADGTRMAPSTTFTKIWRMRNSGNIVWPRGIQLVWVGGDRFSDVSSAEVEVPGDGVPVDGELDIAIDFTAPESPGRYISYWRLASPTGQKFGQRVWVLIEVDASLKDNNLWGSFQGLNLNLPPQTCVLKGPEIIDVNVQPLTDGHLSNHFTPEICVPKGPEICVPKGPEIIDVNVQPLTNEHLSTHFMPSSGTQHLESNVEEQKGQDQNLISEKNFPSGHDNLPKAPMESANIQYPLIDISEEDPVTPAPPVHAPYPVMDAPTSSQGRKGNNDVEKALLKELEDMGFKQLDLNKEILRMNEYDLQRSVDDLCGVAEWDPILEELEEMGFHDKEKNKRLLKKNNGSIKRVVMDLITGEKA